MSGALVPGNGRRGGGQSEDVLDTAPLPAPPEVLFGRFGVASPERLRIERELPAEPGDRKRRRRWPWALLAVVLVAGFATGGFFGGRLTKPSPPTPPPAPTTAAVVGLSRAMNEGQTITLADLKVFTVVTGPGSDKGPAPYKHPLPYVRASAIMSVVSRQVRSALPGGTLLMASDLATTPFPAPGQAEVGLSLQPSQAPTGPSLVPGDHVGVEFVPASSQSASANGVPLTKAKVVSVAAAPNGAVNVTVAVSSTLAAQLTTYAQRDEVALVRLGPGAAWHRPTPPPPPPSAPTTARVLALTQPLIEGQKVSHGDLQVITIVTGGPKSKKLKPLSNALPYFGGADKKMVLGQHVRSALPAGTLLTPSELTNAPFPGKGQAEVGLDLQPSETPSGGALVPGDIVGVEFVPAAQQPPYPNPVPLTKAQVVSAKAGQSNDRKITILVPAKVALRLSGYAQHDEVALVRLGPGSPWPPPGTLSTSPAPATSRTTPVPTTSGTKRAARTK